MKTVPPSHFPVSGAVQGRALQQNNATNENNEGRQVDIFRGAAGEGEGSGEEATAATLFQLAMEHVHRVSSWLDQHGDDKHSSTTDNNNNNDGETTVTTRRGSGNFIIQGGCPFKSFHRERMSNENSDDGNTHNHLARAMEDFSLAAIMGRMASESFDDGEDDEEGGEDGEDGDGGEEELLLHEKVDGDYVHISTIKATASDDDEHQSTQQKAAQQTNDDPPTPPLDEEEEERGVSFSQALKTGTAESHTAAENVHFVNNFIKGIIDRDLYAELVSGLYHTYVTLEKLLEEHAPTHFPTLHFPHELSRTEALEEDMEYWHGLNWRNKVECNTPSPAVRDYIDRLEEVGRIDPLLLLSHAYTRYLGDLSGGKVLFRVARRALNLSGYDGLQFYQFEHVESAKLFKDEYRSALDELVLTPDEIGRLVAEANVAFALNMRVFEELDVKGGVEGARVRNVREALSYYDVEMEEQMMRKVEGRRRERSESVGKEEDAKCPFGFVGGPNPHKGMSTGGDSGDMKVMEQREATPSSKQSASTSSEVTTALQKEHASEGGRCPWPFVFFHDPVTGMKDWQTWFVIGLVLCWCRSQLQ